MKVWQAAAALLALAAVMIFAIGQAGGVSLAALFSDCQPALGERESLLDLTVVDYRQPCERFYWLPYSGDEFYNPIRLNNFGMHDQPAQMRKPDGTFRILIVGDSQTQALQVRLEQSFPYLVESALNTDPAQPVEVVNLSMTGYGTDRALLLYATLGADFAPDVVILALNLADDVLQNNITLDHLNRGTRPSRPYFGVAEERLALYNSPTIDPYASGAPAYEWLVALQNRQRSASGGILPGEPLILRDRPYVLQYPVELGLYLPDTNDWAYAWDITDALLRAFRDLVEQQGAHFGVVVLPDRRQVQTADWRADSNRYPVLWNADPLAPSERIDALLEAAAIPYADLIWTMRSPRVVANLEERLFYFWYPQMTAAGHRITAERLTGWLRAEGFTP